MGWREAHVDGVQHSVCRQLDRQCGCGHSGTATKAGAAILISRFAKRPVMV
jgi:hypothetical protein